MQSPFRSLRMPCAITSLAFPFLACASPDPAPTENIPTTIAPVAADYLGEIITLMQRFSVKRRAINWTEFRADVFATAGPAQTITQTVPGIRRALLLLGDGHSSYLPLRGNPVFVSTRTCGAPTALRPGTPNVGYVRVRQFAGSSAEAAVFAQQLQDSIRVADRDGIVGWIVDVRGNTGGNMYPMIAGIGSILGEGVLGYFLDADGTAVPFSYRDGASYYANQPLQQLTSVYQLKQPNPRVAVLTDGWTASSGEAVVIAFRERANTRSFGSPTCGLSTGNTSYFLSDTARLVLTVSTMADRAKRAYGDVITPDEVIANPDDAVARAIQWLVNSPPLGTARGTQGR